MEQEQRLSTLSASVFQNVVIADEILKQLDFTDLKAFRQLNRSCHQVSIKIWCKTTCVRLQESNSQRTGRTIGEFNQFILQSYRTAKNVKTTSFPFDSFVLENCCNMTDELKLFASQCSRHIKNLVFSNIWFPLSGAEDYFKTFWILISHVESLRFNFTQENNSFFRIAYVNSPIFPKLKRLHLNLQERTTLYFLKRFPSLKELVVNDFTRTRHYWGEALWHRFIMTRMSEREQSILALTTLDIIGTGIGGYHEEFVNANFPLKHLTFNIASHGECNSNWKMILDHYGRNLVTLRLSRGTRIWLPPPLQLLPLNIQFENLVDLELSGNLGNSLDFLKHTPVLVKLKIYKCGVDDHRYRCVSEDEAAIVFGDMVLNSKLLLNSRNFSVPSLKEFRTDRKIGRESWNILKKWMPNLKIMEVPISE